MTERLEQLASAKASREEIERAALAEARTPCGWTAWPRWPPASPRSKSSPASAPSDDGADEPAGYASSISPAGELRELDVAAEVGERLNDLGEERRSFVASRERVRPDAGCVVVAGELRHDGEGTAVVERPEHGDERAVAHDATRLELVPGRR